MKKLFRIIFSRTAVIVLLLLLQLAVLIFTFGYLSEYTNYAYLLFTVLSVIVMLYILNRNENPAFKLAWMIPVLVIPVFGVLMYLFVQLSPGTKLINRRHRKLIQDSAPYLAQDPKIKKQLKLECPQAAAMVHYMNHYGGYPIYKNTQVKYYPLGDQMFPDLLEALKQAKTFIFMEYFIVAYGKVWDSVLDILVQKAKEGVEVRFMYDGMCSLVLLPYNYAKELQKMGIKCKPFSQVRPALSTEQNNRDHRKITVIDGHTAFTGGINLADEYINEKVVYGHWKDTGIRLQGDAVKSFTIMFLQMWDITEKNRTVYSDYITEAFHMDTTRPANGYVMPYGDSPLDHESVGEMVYMDIIQHASRYVHIMTPYLIPDNELLTALSHAAKCGIEVIIIMPHIPDKLYAYLLARTYYPVLIKAGVRIFEYTPGFVHAKVFTSDDCKAVVGTINLDFRSLYLHFECAVYMYQNEEIQAIEYDFQETLKQSQEITLDDCRRYPLWRKLCCSCLRLIAPLM